VICERCGTENPAPAKFCLECGAPHALALTPADDATTLGIARWVEGQIAALRGDYGGAIAAAREAVTLLERTDYVF
jgi:hypothetical protein